MGILKVSLTRTAGVSKILSSKLLPGFLEDHLCLVDSEDIIECLFKHGSWEGKFTINEFTKQPLKELFLDDNAKEKFKLILAPYGIKMEISSEQDSPIKPEETNIKNDDIQELLNITTQVLKKGNYKLAVDLIRLIQKHSSTPVYIKQNL